MDAERDRWDEPYPNRWNADMTLGRAIAILDGPGFACACVGPPESSPWGTPCYCRLQIGQASALHRAAHIVAELLQQVGERRAARSDNRLRADNASYDRRTHRG